MDLCAKCLGNAGELRGMSGESMGVGTKCLRYVGEFREMQWNVWVGAKCQGNAGECRRNLRQRVKSARGMQGNIGKYQGNVLGVRVNRQRNSGKCQENVREWVNSPGECSGMQPGECMEIGPK